MGEELIGVMRYKTLPPPASRPTIDDCRPTLSPQPGPVQIGISQHYGDVDITSDRSRHTKSAPNESYNISLVFG